MKTYLQELRGQVRGNARLKRRLELKNLQLDGLAGYVAQLVTLLDRLGHGDDEVVKMAARSIGWERFDDAKRDRILKELQQAMEGTRCH